MRVEMPAFKRCCCCLPLRRGLLLWAYIKLILLSFLFILHTMDLFYLMKYMINDFERLVDFFIIFLTLLICIVSNFILIVAGHKKNIRYLKVSGISELISTAIAFALLMYYFVNFVMRLRHFYDYSQRNPDANHSLRYWYSEAIVCYLLQIIYSCFQIYTVLMIRSEVVKLEVGHQFRFTNNGAEAECRYYEKTHEPVDEQSVGDQTKE